MEQNYLHKKFTFCNDKKNLIAALNNMLKYVSDILENYADADKIVLRSKWILTELLTNALKHSKDDNISFEFRLENAILEIINSDKGKPFALLIDNEIKRFPAGFVEGNKYVIHKDDANILYVICQAEGTLVFKAEDVEITKIPLQEINEHFGLIVICRSSEEFTYKYDNNINTNVFKAIIQL